MNAARSLRITLYCIPALIALTFTPPAKAATCWNLATLAETMAKGRIQGVPKTTAQMVVHDTLPADSVDLTEALVVVDYVYDMSSAMPPKTAAHKMRTLCLEARHGDKVK